ncbi:MAG: SIMPL domain-containing protein [Candidatus Magasanikbacteria bacterium]
MNLKNIMREPETRKKLSGEEIPRACHCATMAEFGKKILWTLFGIMVAYSIVLLGTLIRNNLQEYNYIGKADKAERTILISAEGKSTVVPDIGETTIGFEAEAKTVTEAQEKNTKVMNSLIEKLKALGIDEKDIQTANYNVYPQYDYLEKEGRVLRGYMVSQNVQVKIRDLDMADKVFALAGEVGANQVGGLNFTIDERDAYIAEARQKAMVKIEEKARMLADSLGIQLGKVLSYDEYESGGAVPMYKAYAEDMVYGMGGGVAAPTIEAGSTEVVLNVNVTFEIK